MLPRPAHSTVDMWTATVSRTTDEDRGSGGPHLSTRISGSPSHVMPCRAAMPCHPKVTPTVRVGCAIAAGLRQRPASTTLTTTKTSRAPLWPFLPCSAPRGIACGQAFGYLGTTRSNPHHAVKLGAKPAPTPTSSLVLPAGAQWNHQSITHISCHAAHPREAVPSTASLCCAATLETGTRTRQWS